MKQILLFILLIFTSGCMHIAVNTTPTVSTATLAGQTFELELARTGAERARGLSGRDPLGEARGMLFVFETPAAHSFWMKEMKFPLDIIWIRDSQVVDIWANAPTPLAGQAVPRYTPQGEANYVLEVDAGFVDRSGLKIGDRVEIDLIK